MWTELRHEPYAAQTVEGLQPGDLLKVQRQNRQEVMEYLNSRSDYVLARDENGGRVFLSWGQVLAYAVTQPQEQACN